MSSIKDFELAQRIHIATHELKTRIAALEAERADLIKINNKWAGEWDKMREQVEEMRKVIEAAKAMRDAGVSIGQRVVLPDAEPDSMADDTALGEFIGIFDGPLQRDFDAALAALDKEQK